jgi:hypothetical protein
MLAVYVEAVSMEVLSALIILIFLIVTLVHALLMMVRVLLHGVLMIIQIKPVPRQDVKRLAVVVMEE